MDQNDLLMAGLLPDDPTADCEPYTPPTKPSSISLSLERTQDGRVKATRANAIALLDAHPRWAGKLWFNLFDGRVWFGDAELDDHLLNELTVDLSAEAGSEFTRERVHHAVVYVARKGRRHAVADYLSTLVWDGTERLDRLLPDYLGSPDEPFVQMLGRKWAVSAVSRPLDPGNKVDTTLVLVGAQGIGESRALRTLAVRPDWFNDTSLDIGSRDGRMALSGTWLVELAELDSLKRSQLSATKAFLTDQEDRYRLPYARTEVTVKRSCVFVGTTNERVMLRDATGNRRFWPVEVGRVSIAALERDRDQLWAEAVHRYRAGEPWWLTKAESRELEKRSEGHTQPTAGWTLWRRGLPSRPSPSPRPRRWRTGSASPSTARRGVRCSASPTS